MKFSNVHICATLSDDRIYGVAIKSIITKEAQERDVVDPSGLKEATTFKRVHLLRFLYFLDSEISRLRIGMDDFERPPNERLIWESYGHPGEVSSDIKSDRKVCGAVKQSNNLFVFHNSSFPAGIHFPTGWIRNLAAHTGIA